MFDQGNEIMRVGRRTVCCALFIFSGDYITSLNNNDSLLEQYARFGDYAREQRTSVLR